MPDRYGVVCQAQLAALLPPDEHFRASNRCASSPIFPCRLKYQDGNAAARQGPGRFAQCLPQQVERICQHGIQRNGDQHAQDQDDDSAHADVPAIRIDGRQAGCLVHGRRFLTIDQGHSADVDHVTRAQDCLADRFSVHQRAAGRVQVKDVIAAVDGAQLGMHPADLRVIQHQLVAVCASDGEHGIGQGHVAVAVDDQECIGRNG